MRARIACSKASVLKLWCAHKSRTNHIASAKFDEGLEKKKKKTGNISQARDSEAPVKTAVLERKKKRKLSVEGGSRKCPRSSKQWFSSSPLKSKGDSKDMTEEGEVRSPTSTPPNTLI